jgi:hypothetical protein
VPGSTSSNFDEATAERFPSSGNSSHRTTDPDAFAFFTLRVENGLDSVGSVVVRGRHVINLASRCPVRLGRARTWRRACRHGPGRDQLARMMETTVKTLKDPALRDLGFAGD